MMANICPTKLTKPSEPSVPTMINFVTKTFCAVIIITSLYVAMATSSHQVTNPCNVAASEGPVYRASWSEIRQDIDYSLSRAAFVTSDMIRLLQEKYIRHMPGVIAYLNNATFNLVPDHTRASRNGSITVAMKTAYSDITILINHLNHVRSLISGDHNSSIVLTESISNLVTVLKRCTCALSRGVVTAEGRQPENPPYVSFCLLVSELCGQFELLQTSMALYVMLNETREVLVWNHQYMNNITTQHR